MHRAAIWPCDPKSFLQGGHCNSDSAKLRVPYCYCLQLVTDVYIDKTPLFSLCIYVHTYISIHMHGTESFLRSYRFSASQEFPCILWNPKVHYRIHESPPSVSTLNQISPVYASTSHLLRVHFNIIPFLCLGLPSSLFPSGLPTKTLYALLRSSIRATCPAHLILIVYIYIHTHTCVCVCVCVCIIG